MTGLPINSYNRQILDVALGLVFNDENEAAGFTLSINNKCVMMTSVASPSSFNEVIKNAVESAFDACHYDTKEKMFLYPAGLFDGGKNNPSPHTSPQKGEGVDTVNEETGEISEAQAKQMQDDLVKSGFPFDNPPPEDYDQTVPNDVPEEMFDTLVNGQVLPETKSNGWKSNVQRMQKFSR